MDHEQGIVEQVRRAVAANERLSIRGGGSKAFYTGPYPGRALDVSTHTGIVEYDPGELVLTCRAGTPLADLRACLAENGQHLPFEPPAFGEAATVGGTVACGFSGPGRPWAGSLRDYLLGVKLVNGHGKCLQFGGQVMKNVAGYDVSRLVAGSRGTLGVILEVSFKVLPRPAIERTLRFDCDPHEAIRRVAAWSARPLPLSASAWHAGRLSLRLSGAESETAEAAEKLGAVETGHDPDFWRALREHQLEFFRTDAPLWRLSVPAATPPADLEGDWLLDWGGAQRWYVGNAGAESLRAAARTAGGHATLFRGEIPGVDRFQPLPAALQALNDRVRKAFDPLGVFNRNTAD